MTVGVDLAIDAIFLIDICLNFVTAYYDSYGRLVIERREIVHHYLFGWFALDVIAILPFEHMANLGSNQRLFTLLRMPRILRFSRILAALERAQVTHAVRLLKVVIFTLLVVHWVACVVYYTCDVAPHDLDGEQLPWCEVARARDAPDAAFASSSYAEALHLAVLTMMGDGVDASSDAERAVFTSLLLLGALLYAAVLGHVSTLIASRNHAFLRHQEHTDKVKDMLEYMQVPEFTRQRVNAYYDYTWLRYKDIENSQATFAASLPTSLRDELLLHLHADMLRQVPLARAMRPSQLLELVHAMQTRVALPGDYVIVRGDEGSGLFMIARGHCEVMLNEASEDDVDGNGDDESGAGDSVDGDFNGVGIWKGKDNVANAQARTGRRTMLDRRASNVSMLGLMDDAFLNGSKDRRASLASVASARPSEGAAPSIGRRGSIESAASMGRRGSSGAVGAVTTTGNPVLGPGAYFGDRSLMTGDPVAATICALTFCELSVLPAESFRELAEANPELEEAIVAENMEFYAGQSSSRRGSTFSHPGSDTAAKAATTVNALRLRRNKSAMLQRGADGADASGGGGLDAGLETTLKALRRKRASKADLMDRGQALLDSPASEGVREELNELRDAVAEMRGMLASALGKR